MSTWEAPRRRTPRRAVLAGLVVVAGAVAAWTITGPGSGTPQVDVARPTPTDDAVWAPPRPGLWVLLPPAPVMSRIDHAIAGSGERVAVWGGFDARGRRLDDGAVLDLDAGTWTRLPTAGAGGTSAEVVWVGDEAVVVSAVSTRTYDAVRGAWRAGPGLPLRPAEALERVAATDDLVVASTRPAVGGLEGRPGVLVWPRATRRWRRLPDPPTAPADGGVVLATGGRLVALRPASPRVRAVASELDPSVPAAWTAIPRPPAAERPLDRLLGSVVEGRIVLVGADETGDAVLAVVRDPRGTWRRVPLPPATITAADDLLAVGRDAVLWDRRAGAGVVLDVAGGRWDPLPRSPAADGVPRPAVEVGPYLVTWGGLDPVGAVHRVR